MIKMKKVADLVKSITSEPFNDEAKELNMTTATETFDHLYTTALKQRADAPSIQSSLFASSTAVNQLLAQRWAQTQAADAKRKNGRRVHYLSMEFLMGRALNNALDALNMQSDNIKALGKRGPTLPEVIEQEPDAALGNGGLGRLAACFLDSFATLKLPSFGYGLRYEHGMFAQRIQDGQQFEVPDQWLRHGNPWEIVRNEVTYNIGFGGAVHSEGGTRRWVPAQRLIARAVDFIVPGHNTTRVSTLRQWQAQSADPIDFAVFCRGDYNAAAMDRTAAQSLNWVLYPDDSTAAGREMRLKQEFLLVSASIQDMIARHIREGHSIETFGRRNVVHLNDTHPAISPAELMRLLLDEHGLAWDAAWRVTTQAVSYTNHTLMPEALETWPVRMFEQLLPRHLEIIYEINRRFLEEVRVRFPNDDALVQRVSLIDESGERRVRMAALAIVASTKVNGVSALHSDLMVQTIFADYAKLWPQRFINVTNGVTPRRWLIQANPGLSGVLDQHIGTGWRKNLNKLQDLRALADHKALIQDFLKTKQDNKKSLATLIRRDLGITINPNSLFDVQIKRIHEYKRQLLNVLHVVARYQAIVQNPQADWTPRTIIIAGKAASAYWAAKKIIQLIHDVARVINSDPIVGDRLKVVFIPNYGVSLAQQIIPAADLSEQISTAGTEASGTGNMKFAMNGALTIGTWDGANIEMAQAMGEENMFVFGLREQDVTRIKSLGYDPRLYAEENLQLRAVLEAIQNGFFSPSEPDRYSGLIKPLLQHDPYMLLADFAEYVKTQAQVDALYMQPNAWAKQALLNIAGMGLFSADRTIEQYVDLVWAEPPAN